jgi:hypothetical protein
MVQLRSDGKAILARAIDLSMAGLALLDPGGIEKVEQVAIPLPGESKPMVLPAKLIRRADNQIGIEFTHLEWDDVLTLARYLSPRL